MIRKLLVLLSGISLLFLFSCQEKTGIMDQPKTFSIQLVSVPERISVSRVNTYHVAFEVTHPQGVEAVDSVWVTFFGSNQSTTFFTIGLFDDGGIDHGDVIARDGIFTNTFQSDSTVFPLGDVFIRATAVDQNQQQLQTDFISSLSLLNKAPILISISVPDTLPSGSPTVLFSVTVQDSNDIDDVDEVILKLKRQNLTVFSTDLAFINASTADTALFGIFFDSSFAAERFGDYMLQFQAVDLSGHSSQILTKAIYLENEPPQLFKLQMVDSLKLPPTGQVNTTLITIQANDPQGLPDIDSVYFNSFLPNDSAATNNPFIMYDNGLPYNPGGGENEAGDLVANDGIYSITIALFPNTPTGRYKFFFFARDKVGQLTPGPVDSINVYQ